MRTLLYFGLISLGIGVLMWAIQLYELWPAITFLYFAPEWVRNMPCESCISYTLIPEILKRSWLVVIGAILVMLGIVAIVAYRVFEKPSKKKP